MSTAQGPATSELEQAGATPEFGEHTPLAEKLLAVAIRAQNFTGSTGVAIALTEGQEMVCRASWGTSAPDVGAQLSVERGFTGLCVRTGHPLRCDDALSDPRVDPEACRALGISAIAVAPVRRGVKVVGVIAAFSDTPNAFTDKHLLILTTLSEVIVELLGESQPLPPADQTAEWPALVTMADEVAEPLSPLDAPLAEPGSLAAAPQEPTPMPWSAAAKTAPVVSPLPVTPPPKAQATPQDSGAELFEVRRQKDGPPPKPLESSAPQPSKAVAPSSTRLVPLGQPARGTEPLPGLIFSGYETAERGRRRWLLLAVVGAILALIAVAAWRWHTARRSGMSKAIPTASTQTQAAPAPPSMLAPASAESQLVEAKHSALISPAKAPLPSKSAAALETADVTVRSGPQPVVEAEEPTRRPTAKGTQLPETQAPQLALASSDLPTVLAKPAIGVVGAPVSRMVPAQLVTRVPPAYPEAARHLQLTGKVVLKATITKTGSVGNVEWVSGNEIFRNNALSAVKQWRYKPAMLNGQPTESDLQIILQFNRPSSQ